MKEKQRKLIFYLGEYCYLFQNNLIFCKSINLVFF